MADVDLHAVAQAMVAEGKGILAADESTATMGKRLREVGLESTEETRRSYRELIVSTPNVGEWISGVILYDETLRQNATDGRPLGQVARDNGVIPGIKVDKGAKPLAGSSGETITEGLDGLRERLQEYVERGAQFAKWRAVYRLDEHRPTPVAVHTNAHALARYAALCQEAGLVPIVEPEVLMDGDHDLRRCEEATTTVLLAVFDELAKQRVALEGMVLKPNMVVSGKECPTQASASEVADATVRTLSRTVPAAVPGIAFLSGGQSDADATNHLNEINLRRPLPWRVTFSYGRALLSEALQTWAGAEGRVAEAQKTLATRARLNGAASRGEYNSEEEAALLA